ncbi:hypothetical protein ElyMa_004283600 [Elysia marginata]|uniref:Uncharacterized protein n=1 Tax=Elysia marginata TaxID=1093978 RepID=A0AAV4GUQ0_9GAST|nr:hypothetical protein ElyMa_004283600 [Elysia marginata]
MSAKDDTAAVSVSKSTVKWLGSSRNRRQFTGAGAANRQKSVSFYAHTVNSVKIQNARRDKFRREGGLEKPVKRPVTGFHIRLCGELPHGLRLQSLIAGDLVIRDPVERSPYLPYDKTTLEPREDKSCNDFISGICPAGKRRDG